LKESREKKDGKGETLGVKQGKKARKGGNTMEKGMDLGKREKMESK
jgi:hypothetical protein